MKQQTSYKTFFINYAIFVMIAAAVFGILIYICRVSQKSWDNNLKAVIESSLAETEPDTWEIGKPIRIENPTLTSSACFYARNKKSGESCRVMIIRLLTFYGPHTGIYLIDNQGVITFKGYTSVHGRCSLQLTNSTNSRRVEYWKMRISEMLKREEEVKK